MFACWTFLFFQLLQTYFYFYAIFSISWKTHKIIISFPSYSSIYSTYIENIRIYFLGCYYLLMTPLFRESFHGVSPTLFLAEWELNNWDTNDVLAVVSVKFSENLTAVFQTLPSQTFSNRCEVIIPDNIWYLQPPVQSKHHTLCRQHPIITAGTWLSLGQLWKVYFSCGNWGRGTSFAMHPANRPVRRKQYD